jgi:hypothetical protein
MNMGEYALYLAKSNSLLVMTLLQDGQNEEVSGVQSRRQEDLNERYIVLGAGVVKSRTREEGKAVRRVGASAWVENRKEQVEDPLCTVPNVLVVEDGADKDVKDDDGGEAAVKGGTEISFVLKEGK